VHGVFPSNRKKSASSRTFQIHQDYVGDSEEIVTPFMQVGTHPTRNFATLGPLWLQPPFTEIYIHGISTNPFYLSAPGRCQTLYIVLQLSRVLCF